MLFGKQQLGNIFLGNMLFDKILNIHMLCYSVEMIWHLVEAINLIDFRLNEDAFVVFSYKVIVLKWFGISRKLKYS